MTFTNKNKFFQYTVTLDTSHNIFRASLVNDSNIYGAGDTIVTHFGSYLMWS